MKLKLRITYDNRDDCIATLVNTGFVAKHEVITKFLNLNIEGPPSGFSLSSIAIEHEEKETDG